MRQIIYDDFEKLKQELGGGLRSKKVLLVCAKSQSNNDVADWLERNCEKLIRFCDFSANPKIEEAWAGLQELYEDGCDFLVSMGGGSAIDVAKVIKAMTGDDRIAGRDKTALDRARISESLNDPRPDEKIQHLAIPTTAGTGSESTHFAVIYYEGTKYSVSEDRLLPNYVLLQPKLLASLPEYQKKSTMLDALCQGIESYWSVKSTQESQQYAAAAIKLILENCDAYINGDFAEEVAAKILKAANLSGQAINISQTTAAHAMSYKITGLYGLAHGHAVAVCLPWVWEYMLANMALTIDARGEQYVTGIMDKLARLFGVSAGDEAIEKMFEIYEQIGIQYKHVVKAEDVDVLVRAVNVERLGNNPVKLDEGAMKQIYMKLV